QVAVDRSREILADEHRRLEVELPPAEEIDVQGVELRGLQHWSQPGPAPGWHAASHNFASSLVVEVAQLDAIVGVGDGDRPPVARDAVKPTHELSRGMCEIFADLDDGNDLPILAQRGVHSAERVADAAPFLDRRRARVAPVDDVPDDGAD